MLRPREMQGLQQIIMIAAKETYTEPKETYTEPKESGFIAINQQIIMIARLCRN
jgi:hypothetical protein